MPARPGWRFIVGTWLSLVEHSLGVRGVGSSNLPVPTIDFPSASTSPVKTLISRPRAPQPVFTRQRENSNQACEGGETKRSAASQRQFESARPDH